MESELGKDAEIPERETTATQRRFEATVWARSRGPSNDDAQMEEQQCRFSIGVSSMVNAYADGSVPGTLSAESSARARCSDEKTTGDPCTAQSSPDSLHAHTRIQAADKCNKHVDVRDVL